MSTTTTNMGLTAWDLSNDGYSHTQQANNLVAIDAHDHTSGKGVQIPAAGIANLAVSTAKIADSAVTAAKIADGTITYAKLASAARAVSLGDLKYQWFPSGGSAIIPTEWHIADGSVLTTGNHDWNGGVGSVTLPNLIGAFPFGVIAANMNTAGGSNTLNLAHSHTVQAHSHTVDAHSHGISSDGGHTHLFGGSPLVTRQNAFLGGITVTDTSTNARSNTLQSLFSAAYAAGGSPATVDATMDAASGHSHGGSTATAVSNTNSVTPGTTSALGSTDTRPAWTGLLPLIRIRN